MDPRYKRRATLTFGPNKQGGENPVAMDDGRPVFWKGDPNDIRFGEPVECMISDAQYVSFALPFLAPPEASEKPPEAAPHKAQAHAPKDEPSPKKVKTKTGLKRHQLAAVKDAAEKRARRVASEEAKAALAVVDELQRHLKKLTAEVSRANRSAADAAAESIAARDAVAEFRKGFADFGSRIAAAEADLRALKAAGRATFGAVPKPVPADEANPTDEEIERQIVYQLHQQKWYGGRHTSGEHFRTGYLAKVPERRIREAVKSLLGKGILRRHAKTPEQYSLNTERKPQIAAILGVPDRDFEVGEADEEAGSGASPRTNGAAATRGNDRFVERGSFENTLRGLKERLESLEAAHRDLLSATMSTSAGQALAGQVDRVEDRVAAIQKAMEEQAAEMGALKKRLVEAPPTKLTEGTEGGAPSSTDPG